MAPRPTSHIRVPDWPAPVRYAIAVGAAAAVVALRAALAPLLGQELPFLTLISAVVVSAWAGGGSGRAC